MKGTTTMLCRMIVCCMVLAACARATAAGLPIDSSPPADPFDGLIYQIEHAPVNVQALAGQVNRVSELESAATLVNKRVAPVRPILYDLARSKVIGMLADIPAIGRPAQVAQQTLDVLVLLDRGLRLAISADSQVIRPLKFAIGACDKLRQSHSRADLPAAVKALDDAAPALQTSDDAIEKERATIGTVKSALANLRPFMDRIRMGSVAGGQMDAAMLELDRADALLKSTEAPVVGLRDYVKVCAGFGHAAQANVPGSPTAPDKGASAPGGSGKRVAGGPAEETPGAAVAPDKGGSAAPAAPDKGASAAPPAGDKSASGSAATPGQGAPPGSGERDKDTPVTPPAGGTANPDQPGATASATP